MFKRRIISIVFVCFASRDISQGIRISNNAHILERFVSSRSCNSESRTQHTHKGDKMMCFDNYNVFGYSIVSTRGTVFQCQRIVILWTAFFFKSWNSSFRSGQIYSGALQPCLFALYLARLKRLTKYCDTLTVDIADKLHVAVWNTVICEDWRTIRKLMKYNRNT